MFHAVADVVVRMGPGGLPYACDPALVLSIVILDFGIS
jgi:hypothetical protein